MGGVILAGSGLLAFGFLRGGLGHNPFAPVMSLGVDNGFIRRDDVLAFGVAEQLAATGTSPVFNVAVRLAGRRHRRRLCQTVRMRSRSDSDFSSRYCSCHSLFCRIINIVRVINLNRELRIAG